MRMAKLAVDRTHKDSLIPTQTRSYYWMFKLIFIQTTLPSRQSVWLPSRHTQMSEHCSSRLRNRINFRSRSCVWMDAIHCRQRADIKTYSLIVYANRYGTAKQQQHVIYKGDFTSGVRTLRWDTTAGTDMMWMRKDLSRLSEKWAAMTGLKNIRLS